METEEEIEQEPARTGPSSGTLIRDAFVVQLKLIVDGLRDFLLVPASVIAAIVSLVSSKDGKPGPQFYQMLALGRRSETWIDLFGALRNAPPDVAHKADLNETIDDMVRRVESYVVDEYRRGEVSRQAKERIDEALDAIQKRRDT